MTARAIGDLLNGTAPQSYAPWKVWKGSTRSNVKFYPLAKKRAVKIFHDARRFNNRTRARGRQDGALGRNAILVLHTLVFDFLNYESGRLDPGYAAIAAKAGMSIRSVARGLARLKAAGVLNWVQRCYDNVQPKYSQSQGTNAYAILPQSQWRGFWQAPEPDRDSLGLAPLPASSVLQLAAELLQGGLTKAAQAIMETDPGDGLASAIARLGRLRQHFNGAPV